ncbi:MAG: Hpt domain-containing protein [Bdellovibrionota bacterium]
MSKNHQIRSTMESDEILRMLLPTFLQHLSNAIKELHKGLKEESWKNLGTVAHRLKGSAGTYGFPDIVTTIEAFERELKNKSRKDVLLLHILKLQELSKYIVIDNHTDDTN